MRFSLVFGQQWRAFEQGSKIYQAVKAHTILGSLLVFVSQKCCYICYIIILKMLYNKALAPQIIR